MNICGLNFFEGEKAIRVNEQLKFIKKIFSTKPTNIFNIIEHSRLINVKVLNSNIIKRH